MPKQPDKSKQVRIRSAEAQIISDLSEKLDISFLDALYRMVNYYHLNPPSSDSPTVSTSLRTETKPQQSQESQELDLDELELNLEAFE